MQNICLPLEKCNNNVGYYFDHHTMGVIVKLNNLDRDTGEELIDSGEKMTGSQIFFY